jgi:hypothetical protein
VGFYHGGDPLYSLDGVPGVWHERCLVLATWILDLVRTGPLSTLITPRLTNLTHDTFASEHLMPKPTPIPYSTGQFFSDVEREFEFLKTDFGMVEISSTHTSYGSDRDSPLGLREPARSSSPVITYGSDHARVVFSLDAQSAVEIVVQQLPLPSGRASVQDVAASADAPNAERYGTVYDSDIETPSDVLGRLAEGLRRYGTKMLAGPDRDAF